MRWKVKVPGSCGELVQGFYRGEPILITCPIKKFSTVEVSDEFFEVEGLGEKSLQMLEKMLNFLQVERNFGIKLTSEIPKSKGMASSSADLAAVANAVAKFCGMRYLSSTKIAEFAAQIEPTDGVFYQGIVAMNPVTGKFVKDVIGMLGRFTIAIFDYGGEIDTLKFNRRSDFEIENLPVIFDFDLVEKSALANQKILYKPHLEDIINFAKNNAGAAGVNVAHSGTVIGIFFHRKSKHIDRKIKTIQKQFDFIKFLTKTEFIGGGCFSWRMY